MRFERRQREREGGGQEILVEIVPLFKGAKNWRRENATHNEIRSLDEWKRLLLAHNRAESATIGLILNVTSLSSLGKRGSV